MSDAEDVSVEERKKSPILAGLFFLVIVIGAVAAMYYAKKAEKVDEVDQSAAVYADKSSAETTAAAPAVSLQDGVASEFNAEFDLVQASTPRILGNPEAPIKISEHSSFTCPACASFHAKNFKLIVKDFVDTGKAYIVFDDFPRNKFDMEVGAIARCLPVSSYFQFVNLVFETQKQWLNDDYIKHIRQNAKLAGASDEKIDQCLGNKELYEALAKRQQETMKNYDIQGTPSLVINDDKVVSGIAPYLRIKEVLNAAIADMPIDPDTNEPIKESEETTE